MTSTDDRLRVTIVAMTVGFGSAPYVQMLPEALSKHVKVSLLAPSHFNDAVPGAEVIKFRTGVSPKQALVQCLKPWSHLDVLRKLRATRPEVIHILNGYGYPWALAIAALSNAPLITTLHDPSPHPGNKVDAVAFHTGKFTLAHSAGIHIHDEVFREGLRERFRVSRFLSSGTPASPAAIYATQSRASHAPAMCCSSVASNITKASKFCCAPRNFCPQTFA